MPGAFLGAAPPQDKAYRQYDIRHKVSGNPTLTTDLVIEVQCKRWLDQAARAHSLPLISAVIPLCPRRAWPPVIGCFEPFITY
jgi:hypothetical protein